jgi:hypothetical protein
MVELKAVVVKKIAKKKAWGKRKSPLEEIDEDNNFSSTGRGASLAACRLPPYPVLRGEDSIGDHLLKILKCDSGRHPS